MIKNKLFFILIFLTFSVFAQVFIPFGYWASQGAFTVSPSGIVYMFPQDVLTFTAAGGTGSYSWDAGATVFADGGGVGPGPSQTDTGPDTDYLSRATAYATNTLAVTSGAQTINISVITYEAMNLSPTTVTIAVNTTQQFTNTFGYCSGVPGACTNATTTWSIVSGLGSISASGLFTASATPGTTVIQAADSIGNIETATITITNTLTITPATLKLPVYSTANYSAILGTSPYTFSVFAGSGSVGCNTTLNGALTTTTNPIVVVSTSGCPTSGVIFVESEQICYSSKSATQFLGTVFNGTTVVRGCNGTVAAAHASGIAVNSNRSVYTAPATTGSSTIRVTDVGLATSDSAVTIVKPTDIVMGYAHMCATYNDGSLKCWGENANGQLGIGSTSTMGDAGFEVGGAIPFVDLGVGRTPIKVVAGFQHTCALLDDSSVKCWGDNGYGQLGIGGTTDATTPTVVSFGARIPTDIWARSYSTCATFTNNTTVCWGLNTKGQAGNGTVVNVSTPPVAGINFGSSQYAISIAGTTTATCALLNDSTVQCWGENSTNGQLGYGNLTDRTSPTGTALNFGAGLSAIKIIGYASSSTSTTSEGSFCALLDDNTMKCWGRGTRGQIGDNGAVDRTSPTATVALGFTPSEIYSGREFNCVLTPTNNLRCWGRNTTGQLLIGSTTQQNSAATCKTTLTGAHTAVVTTITVASTTNCAAASATGVGKILIGTEVICFTGKTATTFTGATRGCDGTTAAAYAGGTQVLGIASIGLGTAILKVAVGGRNVCVLTGGGTTNNDRIACWGNNLNVAGNAQSGLMLYHSTYVGTTAGWIGDAAGEMGDNVPFLNH